MREARDLAARGVQAYRERLPGIETVAGPGAGMVYFLTPDYDRPAGGLRVFYRHVDTLNAAGIGAAILHSKPGFSCSWFEHTTRIADVRSTRIGTGDLLVVPEVYAALLPSLPAGVRHVIFNQNQYLTLRREADAVARHYATSPDLLAVLTVSRAAADMLRYGFPGRDVRIVRNAVDPATFHPGGPPSARVLTYMPRRGKDDAELALRLLRSRGALEGWEIRPLDGLSQAEIAAALRESSVFLALSYQEGFGLPAVEAMACGNLVVGYDGIAGAEFFLPELSRAVPAADVLALARAVEDVLERERREPGFCRATGLAASGFVLDAYAPERGRDDLLAIFGELLDGHPAGAERSVAHA